MISRYMMFSEDVEDRSLQVPRSFQHLMKTNIIKNCERYLLLFLSQLLLWCDATICSLMETLEKQKQRGRDVYFSNFQKNRASDLNHNLYSKKVGSSFKNLRSNINFSQRIQERKMELPNEDDLVYSV